SGRGGGGRGQGAGGRRRYLDDGFELQGALSGRESHPLADRAKHFGVRLRPPVGAEPSDHRFLRARLCRVSQSFVCETSRATMTASMSRLRNEACCREGFLKKG